MNQSERNTRTENLVLVINALFPPFIILAIAVGSYFALPPDRREIIFSSALSASAAAWTVRTRSVSESKPSEQNISLEAELNAGEDHRGSGRQSKLQKGKL